MPAVLTAALRSCVLAGVACAMPVSAAQTHATGVDAAPLSIGETFEIESSALGERRRINVYLPAAYRASDDARLPVLYMPDGGLQEDFLHVAGLVQVLSGNGGMRPVILVGIENTQRRRDLTGPTEDPEDRAIAPQVGGAAAFRMFLRDELMPRIEARYRTTDEDAIVGESLAGLFVIETLAQEPTLFDRYIAIDPSLWWNRKALAESAPQWLARASDAPVHVHIASGREAIESPTPQRFIRALQTRAPSDWTVTHTPFPQESHATVFHPAALQAFRTVFAPAVDDATR